MANEYDVVVVGAGTGGYPAAIRAAQLGLTVAVVERQKALGGTCLIWGCIPTKALLEHAHALKVAQGAKEWGLNLDAASLRLDMKQVQARKDKVVTTLTKGVEFLFRKNKIDWIKGTARLAGGRSVEVTGEQPQTLVAKKEIIVATGSQPRSVPGVEIDRKRIITSDEAIGLREVPKSIVILGAGAVGVEFGSMFRAYGSEVTIVELLPRMVPIEDEAVSAELQKAFRKRGIKTFTGVAVTSAQASDSGVSLEVQTGDGKTERLQADYLLVATGRGPVTEGLGAPEAGIRLERGYVLVDEHYRTGVPGISAVGDVITFEKPGHPQLAHVSTAEGIAVAERIGGTPASHDQLRPGPGVHVLRSRDRQRRPDRAEGEGARLRRERVELPLHGPRAREDRGRDGGVRQDRRREEVRRGARRAHHRAARHRPHRRGLGRAAPRVHRRGAGAHDPRAPDLRRGGRRGRARAARRRDPHLADRRTADCRQRTEAADSRQQARGAAVGAGLRARGVHLCRPTF